MVDAPLLGSRFTQKPRPARFDGDSRSGENVLEVCLDGSEQDEGPVANLAVGGASTRATTRCSVGVRLFNHDVVGRAHCGRWARAPAEQLALRWLDGPPIPLV